jgi:hypothetical protein
MAITYTVGEYDPATSDSVEVIYVNSENGFEHKRIINIPRLQDGSGVMDEEYFAEILEGQLRGVENKLRVGAVTFTDPNAQSEEVPAESTAP